MFLCLHLTCLFVRNGQQAVQSVVVLVDQRSGIKRVRRTEIWHILLTEIGESALATLRPDRLPPFLIHCSTVGKFLECWFNRR